MAVPALAATISVPLAWNPSGDTGVAGYKIYYGTASHSYTKVVNVGNVTNSTINGLSGSTTYYFAATSYDATGLESDYSNEATYTANAQPVYVPPTLNTLANITINENAGQQTVSLSGISTGSGSSVVITASSSNPGLIPNPAVSYTSPNSTGSLTFTPAANAYGSATITVTANNGQAQSNLVTRTFTVTVNQVFLPPTLNALGNLTFNKNAGQQTVGLSGISPGSGSSVAITASSSNPGLIPNPAVSYTSPNSTGSLTFTPATNAYGSATITVTANNGQAKSNLVTRTFTVTINQNDELLPPTLNPPSDATISENAGIQAVGLSGIGPGSGSSVVITASSSNPGLIPSPVVNYTSPNVTGYLTITPASNAYGTAIITVTADNGQPQNNLVTRTFTVTVQQVYQPPTIGALNNLTVNENAGIQTVGLSGIGLGSGQTLAITASSSNPDLIPNPAVHYSSPSATGSLTFTPVANATGTASITLTGDNGAPQSNLVTRTFTVTVAPPGGSSNNPAATKSPTLNALGDLNFAYNSAAQTITLSGIGPNPNNVSKKIKISASSSNTKVVGKPKVSYRSPSTTGTLTLKPGKNASGTATITVTVNDGAKTDNVITRTFTVTVAPNVPPTLDPISNLVLAYGSPAQTISLTGISVGAAGENQKLKINATSSDSKLVKPKVSYRYPSTTGTLTFNPSTKSAGTATITVTVNDGGSANNIFTRTFTVTILPETTSNAASTSSVLPPSDVTLTSAASVNGVFSFQVNGLSGHSYAVEASTDMVNWTPLQTNAASFYFEDTEAGQHAQRFYRAVEVTPAAN